MMRKLLLWIFTTSLVATLFVSFLSFLPLGRYYGTKANPGPGVSGRFELATAYYIDLDCANGVFHGALSFPENLSRTRRPLTISFAGFELDYLPLKLISCGVGAKSLLQEQRVNSEIIAVAIPLWMLMLPFAFYFSIMLRHRIQQSVRRRRGLCVKCGYNLTGAPEARCPECGKSFATTAR